MSISFELRPGESEVIEGYANKIGFFGGPGGKLVLTNQRLLFTNRRKNQIKTQIPLSEIIHVGKASNATIWGVLFVIGFVIGLFLRNAIRVTMKGGVSQRFVVNNRARWIDLIDEYRRASAK